MGRATQPRPLLIHKPDDPADYFHLLQTGQHAVLTSRDSHSDYVVVILSALCFPVSVDPKVGGALGAVEKAGSRRALPRTRARSRTDGAY